jgi:hypothetical protein
MVYYQSLIRLIKTKRFGCISFFPCRFDCGLKVNAPSRFLWLTVSCLWQESGS